MPGRNRHGQRVLWFLALFSYMKERDLHQMAPKGEPVPRLEREKLLNLRLASFVSHVFSASENSPEVGQGAEMKRKIRAF